MASAYAGWAGSLPAAGVEQRLHQALVLADLAPAEFVGALLPTMFSEATPTESVDEFGSSMRAFQPADFRSMAQALADVATIGILPERSIRSGDVVSEQLQSALNSRVIVEQAKGVLAQHFGEDMQAAFERLHSYARPRSLRMGELARQIAAGECDLAALGSPEGLYPGPSEPDRVGPR